MICESTENGVVIEVPRQFGKYTYVRTIGSAASSVVLLVVDQTGQQYAAKCVKRDFLGQDSNLEYFEREIRLLQFIRHPHIVQLHEIVYQTDNIIVIMEFCEFGDLFDELAANGALTIRRLRSYIYQILKALQFLHDKGFAHRDLKPENILIASESVVKIADLGLARAIPASGMMTTICGSVHYMAPEILQELPYDGPKADIWSFGVIVFAMTVNQLPWKSRDNASLVREIIRGAVAMPSHILPEIAQVISLCLNKNPRERPSAGELLEVPWVSEEFCAYNKAFGVSGKIQVSSLATISGSSSRLVGGPRSTAKLILSKPSLRPVPSLDAKALGHAASPFSRSGIE
jgi:serine/threonine protein kinase